MMKTFRLRFISSKRCVVSFVRNRHSTTRHEQAQNKNQISRNNSSQEQKISLIPLTKSIPWLPSSSFASSGQDNLETKVTRLRNGLQVATQPKFGMFCTLGVLVDSGSRYEDNHLNGISHFLEKLAFSSTEKFSSRDTILQTLEKHGGICDCQGSRDTLIYAISSSVDGIEEMTDLLSEVVLKPHLTLDEVEYARQAIEFELETLQLRPDPEPLLVEFIHEAAYGLKSLGIPKYCPQKNLKLINKNSIEDYLREIHLPSRMVLAGVGVDHNEFVKLAEKYFDKTPSWGSPSFSKSSFLSKSVYLGGIREIVKDLSSVSLGPTPMPELSHFVVALESSCHKQNENFVPTCVLNMIMGGGGSFSAGGPGKGMYSRLYVNILNKHHWIHNATAFNHAYNDSGLFCIHASAHPSSLRELTDVILKEMTSMQGEISEEELSRAKKQLQSMLLMNLEARPVVFEDVGRQVLSQGKRMNPSYYCNLIEKVSISDVRRVAKEMLSSAPSVIGYGDLHELPTYEEIRKIINHQLSSQTSSGGVFSIFKSN